MTTAMAILVGAGVALYLLVVLAGLALLFSLPVLCLSSGAEDTGEAAGDVPPRREWGREMATAPRRLALGSFHSTRRSEPSAMTGLDAIMLGPARAPTRRMTPAAGELAVDWPAGQRPTSDRLAGRANERRARGALIGAGRVLGSAGAALAGGLALVALAEATGYPIWPDSAGLAAWLGLGTAVLIGVSAARQDRATWLLTVVLCASLVGLLVSVGIGTAPFAKPHLAGASLALLTATVLPAAGVVSLLAYAITRAVTELSSDRVRD